MAKKNKNKVEKQSFLKKCVSPIVICNVGGMLFFVAAVLIGTALWLNTYTRHGESVTVPEVEGMQVEYAATQLQALGLNAIVVDSSYNEAIAPGEITDQFPHAGNNVKKGREIRLTINSLCAPLLAIPDLADNCSRRQAELKLQAMGFKYVNVETIPGELDWVYEIRSNHRTLTAGQRVRTDARITIIVGDGSTNPSLNDSTDQVVDEIIDELF